MINLIMTMLTLAVLAYIVKQRIKHAQYFRQAGYKLWGFEPVSAPYQGTRSFTMPNTSWHCKSVYIGFGFEFWWSPGGGFSVGDIFINAIMTIAAVLLAVFAWPVAIILFIFLIILGRLI